MVNRKEKAVGISIFSNTTMVDTSRHGPGITVVEGGVWVTVHRYCVLGIGVDTMVQQACDVGGHCGMDPSARREKKKTGSHTYVFIGFFARFFCGLYHTRVFLYRLQVSGTWSLDTEYSVWSMKYTHMGYQV